MESAAAMEAHSSMESTPMKPTAAHSSAMKSTSASVKSTPAETAGAHSATAEAVSCSEASSTHRRWSRVEATRRTRTAVNSVTVGRSHGIVLVTTPIVDVRTEVVIHGVNDRWMNGPSTTISPVPVSSISPPAVWVEGSITDPPR